MKREHKKLVGRVLTQKPKSGHRLGVKWKLFGFLALFTALILVILWLSQVVFLEDIYKSIKIGEIRMSAKTLVANIDSDKFAERAGAIASRGEMCVLVLQMLDEDNAIELLSIETLPNCAIHNTSKQSKFTLYDSAEKAGGDLLQRFRYDETHGIYYQVDDNFGGRDDTESIIYTLITNNAAGDRILIILNSVISPVSATVETLNRMLIIISAVLLMLALIFAAVISRKITRPIIRINESAKQLASGNYDVLFSDKGYRETAELAETLNYAASELGKVENLRRELIANISHDLRTPLTMIEGYAEVMRDLPGENTPENTQIIIDETKRLTSLVNDMLDLSKLQSGTQEVALSPVNITESVGELLSRYNRLCERDGYVIDFYYDREVTLDTDETRFDAAVYNLVNNAITYTGHDKKVTVRQTVSDSAVRITVSDTGEGIPQDKLENIWERYYKVDKVHRRASVGTGLGLSIVKGICELLGGRYGVESRLGEGSSFWIEFPM